MIYLNGKSTREDNQIVDLDEKEIENINLNDEISNFNHIFGKIGEKLKLINKQAQKDFYAEFQSILKNEIEKINKSVDNLEPNYIYATRIISVIFMLFMLLMVLVKN